MVLFILFVVLFLNIIPTQSAEACPVYRTEIIRATRQYLPTVSASLIAAQALQESSCNPLARSQAGAVGIMQIMPGTARDIERTCKLPGFSPLNPRTAIIGGVCYDAIVRKIVGPMNDSQEWSKAMFRAYNGGAGYVLKERKLARELGFDDTSNDLLSKLCHQFRSESSCDENTKYPIRIFSLQTKFLGWN